MGSAKGLEVGGHLAAENSAQLECWHDHFTGEGADCEFFRSPLQPGSFNSGLNDSECHNATLDNTGDCNIGQLIESPGDILCETNIASGNIATPTQVNLECRGPQWRAPQPSIGHSTCHCKIGRLFDSLQDYVRSKRQLRYHRDPLSLTASKQQQQQQQQLTATNCRPAQRTCPNVLLQCAFNYDRSSGSSSSASSASSRSSHSTTGTNLSGSYNSSNNSNKRGGFAKPPMFCFNSGNNNNNSIHHQKHLRLSPSVLLAMLFSLLLTATLVCLLTLHISITNHHHMSSELIAQSTLASDNASSLPLASSHDHQHQHDHTHLSTTTTTTTTTTLQNTGDHLIATPADSPEVIQTKVQHQQQQQQQFDSKAREWPERLEQQQHQREQVLKSEGRSSSAGQELDSGNNNDNSSNSNSNSSINTNKGLRHLRSQLVTSDNLMSHNAPLAATPANRHRVHSVHPAADGAAAEGGTSSASGSVEAHQSGGFDEARSVQTECGKFVGLIEHEAIVFRGIAYALAPINKRRWQRPVAIWEEQSSRSMPMMMPPTSGRNAKRGSLRDEHSAMGVAVVAAAEEGTSNNNNSNSNNIINQQQQVGPINGQQIASPRTAKGTVVPDTQLALEQLSCEPSKVFRAHQHAPVCQQLSPFSHTFIGREDCLYLDIWAPRLDNKRRPVMVYIHGGFLSFGSSGQEQANLFDMGPSSELALAMDCVMVSLNYRLQALGFLALEQLANASPNGSLGNYGLWDQLCALKWIKRNIVNFGGDPNNVVLFGPDSASALPLAFLSGEMQLTMPVPSQSANIALQPTPMTGSSGHRRGSTGQEQEDDQDQSSDYHDQNDHFTMTRQKGPAPPRSNHAHPSGQPGTDSNDSEADERLLSGLNIGHQTGGNHIDDDNSGQVADRSGPQQAAPQLEQQQQQQQQQQLRRQRHQPTAAERPDEAGRSQLIEDDRQLYHAVWLTNPSLYFNVPFSVAARHNQHTFLRNLLPKCPHVKPATAAPATAAPATATTADGQHQPTRASNGAEPNTDYNANYSVVASQHKAHQLTTREANTTSQQQRPVQSRNSGDAQQRDAIGSQTAHDERNSTTSSVGVGVGVGSGDGRYKQIAANNSYNNSGKWSSSDNNNNNNNNDNDQLLECLYSMSGQQIIKHFLGQDEPSYRLDDQNDLPIHGILADQLVVVDDELISNPFPFTSAGSIVSQWPVSAGSFFSPVSPLLPMPMHLQSPAPTDQLVNGAKIKSMPSLSSHHSDWQLDDYTSSSSGDQAATSGKSAALVAPINTTLIDKADPSRPFIGTAAPAAIDSGAPVHRDRQQRPRRPPQRAAPVVKDKRNKIVAPNRPQILVSGGTTGGSDGTSNLSSKGASLNVHDKSGSSDDALIEQQLSSSRFGKDKQKNSNHNRIRVSQHNDNDNGRQYNTNIRKKRILIGSSQQAVEYWPCPRDIAQWSWQDFNRYVITSLNSFSSSAVRAASKQYAHIDLNEAATAISAPSGLAPQATTNKSLGGVSAERLLGGVHTTPMEEYLTLVSDIRQICPINELTRELNIDATRRGYTQVHRYIIDHRPDKPIKMARPSAASNYATAASALPPAPQIMQQQQQQQQQPISYEPLHAFHTWDLMAFFNASNNGEALFVSDNELKFQQQIRRLIRSFIHLPNDEAQNDSAATSVLQQRRQFAPATTSGGQSAASADIKSWLAVSSSSSSSSSSTQLGDKQLAALGGNSRPQPTVRISNNNNNNKIAIIDREANFKFVDSYKHNECKMWRKHLGRDYAWVS